MRGRVEGPCTHTERDFYHTGEPKVQEKWWRNALKAGYFCDKFDPPCLVSCRRSPATAMPTVAVIPIRPVYTSPTLLIVLFLVELGKGTYSL